MVYIDAFGCVNMVNSIEYIVLIDVLVNKYIIKP